MAAKASNTAFPQLDAPGADASALDTVRYGISSLPALKVIVPEQSPPWDIDYDPATGDVWMAGFASGIRRSTDDGRTWQRVVLPPDGVEVIRPDQPYDFTIEPPARPQRLGQPPGLQRTRGRGGGPSGPVPSNGVNRSRPQDVFSGGRARLDQFQLQRNSHCADGQLRRRHQGAVAAGAERDLDGGRSKAKIGRSKMASTVTRDGGETFEQVLLGERVYDFAFQGERVYAAAPRKRPP